MRWGGKSEAIVGASRRFPPIQAIGPIMPVTDQPPIGTRRRRLQPLRQRRTVGPAEILVQDLAISLPVRLERYIVERKIQGCMGYHVPITPTQHDHRKQQE